MGILIQLWCELSAFDIGCSGEADQLRAELAMPIVNALDEVLNLPSLRENGEMRTQWRGLTLVPPPNAIGLCQIGRCLRWTLLRQSPRRTIRIQFICFGPRRFAI
jgi:hypothetical protein